MILISDRRDKARNRRYLITKRDICSVLDRLATTVEFVPPMENLRMSIRRISEDVSSNNMNNLLNFVINQIFFFYAIGKEATACVLFNYFRKMGIEVDESVFKIIPEKFSYLFLPVEQYRISMSAHVRRLLIEYARKATLISQEVAGFLVYNLRKTNGTRMIRISRFEPITIRNPNSGYVDMHSNIASLKRVAQKFQKRNLILLHSHPYGYVNPSYPDIWNGLMKYMLPIAILATRKRRVYLSLAFFRSKKAVRIGNIRNFSHS